MSMEFPVSCKQFFLFKICSTKSGLQKLLLMSKFWQKWNVLIEHIQLITTSHTEEWHF